MKWQIFLSTKITFKVKIQGHVLLRWGGTTTHIISFKLQ